MIKNFLTIAGSDPSGGAGIQADIRVASRLDLYPCSVVTAVTAQNSNEVSGLWEVPADMIEKQLESVLEDYRPQSVKIGMLLSPKSVETVSTVLRKHEISNIVVDPVLSPTLLNKEPDKDLVSSLCENLFPIATLITPNIEEKKVIESLTGINLWEQYEAVLVKGGHSEDKHVTDVLYYHSFANEMHSNASTAFPSLNHDTLPYFPNDTYRAPSEDDSYLEIKEFVNKRIETDNTHGTGCILSSAISCYLALDYDLVKSVELGIKFTRDALKKSISQKPCQGKYGPALI